MTMQRPARSRIRMMLLLLDYLLNVYQPPHGQRKPNKEVTRSIDWWIQYQFRGREFVVICSHCVCFRGERDFEVSVESDCIAYDSVSSWLWGSFWLMICYDRWRSKDENVSNLSTLFVSTKKVQDKGAICHVSQWWRCWLNVICYHSNKDFMIQKISFRKELV